MPPESSRAACEWFYIIAAIIPWVIAVTGWIVVNRDNNKRESRKELRAKVDRVIQDVRSLHSIALKYHTAQHRDELAARQIRADLKLISNRIFQLRLLNPERASCLIIDLRQRITLTNFDTREHTPIDVGSEKVAAIDEVVDALENDLEREFRDKYPT